MLESQFRCNGSDGYLAWIDEVLQIRDTANDTLEGINYDFFNSEIPALASEGLTRKAFIKIKDFKLEKFENN